MSDAAKQVVWSASYLPFGGEYQIAGPAALDARFPGQWFQLESGLAYNWHRHYDASLGRYTQPDPLGFVDGPSRYVYVRGDPIGKIDPKGLSAGTEPPTQPSKNAPSTQTCGLGDLCDLVWETGPACYYICQNGQWKVIPNTFYLGCPKFIFENRI